MGSVTWPRISSVWPVNVCSSFWNVSCYPIPVCGKTLALALFGELSPCLPQNSNYSPRDSLNAISKQQQEAISKSGFKLDLTKNNLYGPKFSWEEALFSALETEGTSSNKAFRHHGLLLLQSLLCSLHCNRQKCTHTGTHIGVFTVHFIDKRRRRCLFKKKSWRVWLLLWVMADE